jgi:alpha-1,2-mannosyltransferase
MGSAVQSIREALVGRARPEQRWDDPSFLARTAVLMVLLSILAGMALRASGFVGGAYSWFMLSGAMDDSWFPMGLAYARVTGQTPGTLRDLFFVDLVKFQYPATSLLLYSALDFVGIQPTVKSLNVVVWLSVFATPFVIFQTCVVYIDKNNGTLRLDPAAKYMIAGAFAAATLFFYPIMISWRLGQIQAILNLMFALACLCWVSDRKVASGMFLALTCMIKPQLSLFLVWALLRRQMDFAIGLVIALGCGVLLSLVLYGWGNNIYYLEVLQFISRRGEIFWDNSSVNGFMNGIMHPNETQVWKYHEFPPYHPVTYALTILTSVAIIGMALFWNKSSPASGSALDFGTAGLSFTMASPIAWGHHYGVVMPVFAISFIAIALQANGNRRRNLLIGWGVCLLIFSNYWNMTERLAGTSLAFLQYWRLYAAFGFLWILYRLQADLVQDRTADTTAMPRGQGNISTGVSRVV